MKLSSVDLSTMQQASTVRTPLLPALPTYPTDQGEALAIRPIRMAASSTTPRQRQKRHTWLMRPSPHRVVHLYIGLQPVLLLPLPIILATFVHGVQIRLLVVTVAGSGVADM